MRLIFAVPGDLTSQTGGYRYAREVMVRLPGEGIDVIHCQLSEKFPNPTCDDLHEAAAALNAAYLPGDVALIDGLAYGAFREATVAAIKAPIIALCHHPLGFEAGLEPGRSRELLASERRALALAAGIIVTSASTARTLEREFNVPAIRITVARPGTGRALRAKGSGRAPSLLAIGAITPRKAFGILIEALRSLSDLDWRLSIVGSAHHSPETAAALDRLIKTSGLSPRVECLGELDGTALDHVFHRSDIFVSPSLYEGYGMALAEAMARGLPVITAAFGAQAETVPDEAALKIPPGDVTALAKALRALITGKALRERLSNASWLAGQSLPSWRDTAETIARVVNGIALASK
jgi:glycosyltransferase involved in cell wall biosynthesis